MQGLLPSVPLTLQQASADPRLHQRLLETHSKSGSISCGVAAPFSWVLVCTRFCLCPPRVCFPVLCKFWWLCAGVNGNLLQEHLCQGWPKVHLGLFVTCYGNTWMNFLVNPTDHFYILPRWGKKCSWKVKVDYSQRGNPVSDRHAKICCFSLMTRPRQNEAK